MIVNANGQGDVVYASCAEEVVKRVVNANIAGFKFSEFFRVIFRVNDNGGIEARASFSFECFDRAYVCLPKTANANNAKFYGVHKLLLCERIIKKTKAIARATEISGTNLRMT